MARRIAPLEMSRSAVFSLRESVGGSASDAGSGVTPPPEMSPSGGDLDGDTNPTIGGEGGEYDPHRNEPGIGYIQGVGGGFAWPIDGPAKTQAWVDAWEELADILDDLGLTLGILSGMIGALGVILRNPTLGAQWAILGLYSLLGFAFSKLAGKIAHDPPQRDYARIVSLSRSSMGAVHYQAFSPVADELGGALDDGVRFAQAMLDSLERFQGARDAQDVDWACNHALIARGLSKELRVRLGHIADLLRLLAKEVAESNFDSALVDIKGREDAVLRSFVAQLRTGQKANDQRFAASDIDDMETMIRARMILLSSQPGTLSQRIAMLSRRITQATQRL